jgi:polyhydroxyalkanoate synthesis regulator phasin
MEGADTVNELIEQVAAKAGINPDQAKQAIEAVLEQLQSRLPEPIAGQLRGLLDGGEGGDAPDVGDALKGLGGLFGR